MRLFCVKFPIIIRKNDVRYDMELDYQEIGRRIAKRRRELGYKQAQVEELAGSG